MVLLSKQVAEPAVFFHNCFSFLFVNTQKLKYKTQNNRTHKTVTEYILKCLYIYKEKPTKKIHVHPDPCSRPMFVCTCFV